MPARWHVESAHTGVRHGSSSSCRHVMAPPPCPGSQGAGRCLSSRSWVPRGIPGPMLYSCSCSSPPRGPFTPDTRAFLPLPSLRPPPAPCLLMGTHIRIRDELPALRSFRRNSHQQRHQSRRESTRLGSWTQNTEDPRGLDVSWQESGIPKAAKTKTRGENGAGGDSLASIFGQ